MIKQHDTSLLCFCFFVLLWPCFVLFSLKYSIFLLMIIVAVKCFLICMRCFVCYHSCGGVGGRLCRCVTRPVCYKRVIAGKSAQTGPNINKSNINSFFGLYSKYCPQQKAYGPRKLGPYYFLSRAIFLRIAL